MDETLQPVIPGISRSLMIESRADRLAEDTGNASTADTVTITVDPPANMGPTADAGEDQTVASDASVTLDGSGSSDPDTGDTLSYAWTQTSGTTVSLTGATTAAAGFSAPDIGPHDAAAALVFSLVVTDDKGNVSDADTVTITVNPAEPNPTSEFGLHEAEIRNTITGLGLAGINSTIASNERMMHSARERLLRTQAGQIRDVPFRIDPNLTQMETTLSSSGTFYGQWGGENGQRLVFGDFVLRHDEQTGTTTATLTGRAAWEWMVSGRTLLGAFVGGEFAQSDLIAPRDGAHRRFGLTVGGYSVHEIWDGLFADGFVTLGAGQNNLAMAIGELDLDGDYTTRTLTFGGALSGVIDRGAYQVLPELAFSYGRVRFGEVGFTGHAFSLMPGPVSPDVLGSAPSRRGYIRHWHSAAL